MVHWMLIAACVTGAAPGRVGDNHADDSFNCKVETFVSGLEVPWAMAWTSPDRMLITERKGRVREVVKGVLNPQPLHEPAGLFVRAETGLLGLAVHPRHRENKFVYVARSVQIPGSDGKPVPGMRVERLIDEGAKLVVDRTILEWTPAGPNHAGCSLAFGPDGKLYITTGEAFKGQLAQDMTSLAGKILRVNDDGTPCEDNPFVKDREAGTRAEIWSLGHRNPQGIDWQPGTGIMFETEHGPSGENGSGGDEFNMVEKGKNYGWPVIHHTQTKEGMVSPLVMWDPAVAPASGVFYSGDKFPQAAGNYFVGMLGGLSRDPHPALTRIVLEGTQVVKQERLLTNVGRVRCVAVGPDGYIYVGTSNKDGRARGGDPTDDRILRLVPDAK